MMDDFTINDTVKVFDRYRFGKPLYGKIKAFAITNTGVEIELLESNNPKWPANSRTWVFKEQLRLTRRHG